MPGRFQKRFYLVRLLTSSSRIPDFRSILKFETVQTRLVRCVGSHYTHNSLLFIEKVSIQYCSLHYDHEIGFHRCAIALHGGSNGVLFDAASNSEEHCIRWRDFAAEWISPGIVPYQRIQYPGGPSAYHGLGSYLGILGIDFPFTCKQRNVIRYQQ